MRYLLFAVASALAALPAAAGNFGVSPLDIQFSPQRQSAVINVTNDDSKPLQIRLRASRWTQNAEGEDVYEDAKDLVFFPKRLDIKPGEQKVVRLAINEPPGAAESAWRLFVEELPPAETPRDGQTKLSVLLTIGVPVFASPASAKAELKVSSAVLMRDGSLELKVKNAGGSRSRISRILSGEDKTLTEALPGRYIFPGIEKTYRVKVDPAYCRDAGKLRIETDTATVDAEPASPRCAS
jgi:fimbrial chaperone protein